MENRATEHNHDDDEGEGGPIFGAPLFTNKPLARLHDLYLVGEIRDPGYYVQWYEVIRTARQQDIIVIHINSSGGNGWTALQLMRAMGECEGTVIASVEGMCMSAATFILLSANRVEISNHSMFMFHNFSGVAAGKGGEMFAQVEASKKWSTNILKEVYKDFLTEDEIESLLNSRDMWMDSDEVIVRMKKRAEIQKAQIAEAQKQQTEPVIEFTPATVSTPDVPEKKKRRKRGEPKV